MDLSKENAKIDQISNDIKTSEKKTIKSMNWVIRHKEENMSKKTYKNLNVLKKTNEPLYEAYLLKESFYEFFNFTPIEIGQAKKFLLWFAYGSCIQVI